MASPAYTFIFAAAIAACFATVFSQSSSSGYATYSNTGGGVCSGVSSGLPQVSINAAQFGGGSACGQCVQISGTGNGAGQNPVSTAAYIAVIANVCPQCAPGDLDLQSAGDGKFGITWSFVPCPGAGRRLIEDTSSSQQETVEDEKVETVAIEQGTPVTEEGTDVPTETVVDKPAQEQSQTADAGKVHQAASPEPSAKGQGEEQGTSKQTNAGEQTPRKPSRRMLSRN